MDSSVIGRQCCVFLSMEHVVPGGQAGFGPFSRQLSRVGETPIHPGFNLQAAESLLQGLLQSPYLLPQCAYMCAAAAAAGTRMRTLLRPGGGTCGAQGSTGVVVRSPLIDQGTCGAALPIQARHGMQQSCQLSGVAWLQSRRWAHPIRGGRPAPPPSRGLGRQAAACTHCWNGPGTAAARTWDADAPWMGGPRAQIG